jgi:sterol desaturase/sphingolipid hydroxylase (fatty acid hydroxylase superfamily)
MIPVGVTFLCGLVALSTVEYVSHRWPMHQPLPFLRRYWRLHSVNHHVSYAASRFVHPPLPDDEEGFEVGWLLTLVLISLGLPLLLWSWPAWLSWTVMSVGRNWFYNVAHREMHDPKGRWFSKTRFFQFIAWWHFLHHRHQNRNFAGMLPLWDYVLGTVARPTEKDRNLWAKTVWGNRHVLAG